MTNDEARGSQTTPLLVRLRFVTGHFFSPPPEHMHVKRTKVKARVRGSTARLSTPLPSDDVLLSRSNTFVYASACGDDGATGECGATSRVSPGTLFSLFFFPMCNKVNPRRSRLFFSKNPNNTITGKQSECVMFRDRRNIQET